MKNAISLNKSEDNSAISTPRRTLWGSITQKFASGISDFDPLWQFTVSQLIMNRAGGSIKSKQMVFCAGIIVFMVMEELV